MVGFLELKMIVNMIIISLSFGQGSKSLRMPNTVRTQPKMSSGGVRYPTIAKHINNIRSGKLTLFNGRPWVRNHTIPPKESDDLTRVTKHVWLIKQFSGLNPFRDMALTYPSNSSPHPERALG